MTCFARLVVGILALAPGALAVNFIKVTTGQCETPLTEEECRNIGDMGISEFPKFDISLNVRAPFGCVSQAGSAPMLYYNKCTPDTCTQYDSFPECGTSLNTCLCKGSEPATTSTTTTTTTAAPTTTTAPDVNFITVTTDQCETRLTEEECKNNSGKGFGDFHSSGQWSIPFGCVSQGTGTPYAKLFYNRCTPERTGKCATFVHPHGFASCSHNANICLCKGSEPATTTTTTTTTTTAAPTTTTTTTAAPTTTTTTAAPTAANTLDTITTTMTIAGDISSWSATDSSELATAIASSIGASEGGDSIEPSDVAITASAGSITLDIAITIVDNPELAAQVSSKLAALADLFATDPALVSSTLGVTVEELGAPTTTTTATDGPAPGHEEKQNEYTDAQVDTKLAALQAKCDACKAAEDKLITLLTRAVTEHGDAQGKWELMDEAERTYNESKKIAEATDSAIETATASRDDKCDASIE